MINNINLIKQLNNLKALINTIQGLAKKYFWNMKMILMNIENKIY